MNTSISFDTLLKGIVEQVVNPLIVLLTMGAFVVFLWGVFLLVKNSGDDTKRAEAQSAIFWGIIGLVIIFGVYGILNIATATFGLNAVTPITTQ